MRENRRKGTKQCSADSGREREREREVMITQRLRCVLIERGKEVVSPIMYLIKHDSAKLQY